MTRSFIAEMTISHADLPLTPTIRTVDGVEIAVESEPLTYPDQSGSILFYSVTNCDFRAFDSALETDHTVDEWEVTMDFQDHRVYQIYHTQEAKFTTPEIADLGLQVLSSWTVGRGWELRLHAPDRERLGDYWKFCREENIQFELEKLYSTGPQANAASGGHAEVSLTERQREVARTATRMGYYEPEGASAAEVADELDISPSTLSTHLRRIMAKVFRQLFDD
ncbi:helix-turn-helix domain-containing protein [Haloterrigena sp. SYSU A558-1]|uniref:Helix-turn-helix domain-containing protein n=1 Tax=Haloterrigena gelatinilytica TaxID=2741724 RepID=A0ABX2LEU8_9EURY|nr:helix-turn-helix domain-containing protein [Haloterrigena gelatinilytica]NUC73388.1 helix-turn-helix domain-containing protein [Haloterrigena gelatinilytica]